MPDLGRFVSSISFTSLIDVNFILINRIAMLVITLLFFVTTLIVRRVRNLEVHPRVTAPIKLALFGCVLLYAELALSGIPGYQAVLQSVQTIVVLLCLASLANYLIIDIYLRIHTQEEVPSFLRDTVRLLVYLAVGIISLRLVFKIDISAIITTTTVLTATIAFAMQNTLTNALSGFSIQTDSLLNRRNWISIKEKNLFGEIVNVGFRYTTLRTVDNHLLMVPNSIIMQNIVTYHGNSETVDKPAIQVDVMLGYDVPPETAKRILLQVLLDDQEVLECPEPIVRLTTLNESGITYMLRFWIADPARQTVAQDLIYSQVWYVVNRAGYSFPFPHRQIITTDAKQPFQFSRRHISSALQTSELFSMLEMDTLHDLAENSTIQAFGAGEVIVRQGETGRSLYLVIKGELTVEVNALVVGTIGEDSFFGEMSLLTGEPRTATVRATTEVWLAEITSELLLPILRSTPQIVETLSSILAERELSTKNRQDEVNSSQAEVSTFRREVYLQKLKLFFGL